MTVFDQRCDRCGAYLAGPDEAVRFLYHPGDLSLKDDSGLLCRRCWAGLKAWLGERGVENRCARCGQAVEHPVSLHIQRSGDPDGWQLCRGHAVAFLNQLRTVDPKLDPESFTLAGDWRCSGGFAAPPGAPPGVPTGTSGSGGVGAPGSSEAWGPDPTLGRDSLPS